MDLPGVGKLSPWTIRGKLPDPKDQYPNLKSTSYLIQMISSSTFYTSHYLKCQEANPFYV